MNLTIVYTTARYEPKVEWFLDSLANQDGTGIPMFVIAPGHSNVRMSDRFNHAFPKPTVWQGPNRITKQDWWAAANSRNTGICLCQTDWIAFVDDRCVLLPTWLEAVKDAMAGNYVVCGAYEKRHGMKVQEGMIIDPGTVTGRDHRMTGAKFPRPVSSEWTFGCSIALPLEWALQVNGFDETCDGLGHEDCFFGMMLANNGHPIRLDERMMMIEDRTPEDSGPVMIRSDKGKSPNDKSHALVNKLKHQKRALHGFDIRQVRDDALNGRGFPQPWGPFTDWYDGQPISDL